MLIGIHAAGQKSLAIGSLGTASRPILGNRPLTYGCAHWIYASLTVIADLWIGSRPFLGKRPSDPMSSSLAFWPVGQKEAKHTSPLVAKTAQTATNGQSYKNTCLFSRCSLRFGRSSRFDPLASLAHGASRCPTGTPRGKTQGFLAFRPETAGLAGICHFWHVRNRATEPDSFLSGRGPLNSRGLSGNRCRYLRHLQWPACASPATPLGPGGRNEGFRPVGRNLAGIYQKGTSPLVAKTGQNATNLENSTKAGLFSRLLLHSPGSPRSAPLASLAHSCPAVPAVQPRRQK